MLSSAPLRGVLRRGSFCAVAAVVTALGVLAMPAAPAFAAGTVTVASPDNGAVVNSGSSTFVFNTTDAFITPPTVTLARVGAASDTLSGSNVSTNVLSKTVTATFNFALANPGDYGVTIAQNSTTDNCAGCVHVSALPPTATATSATPIAAGSASQAWTLTGTSFAKGPYSQCTQEPCQGPSIEFLDSNNALDPKITLTDALDSNGQVIAPTATTITKVMAVDPTDSAGPRTIKVFNSDGQAATCSCSLAWTLRSPPPPSRPRTSASAQPARPSR